jgi:hypothetical protein
MVEKQKQKPTVWLPRHSREVHLRRSLGQACPAIAASMGWARRTIDQHVLDEDLDRILTRAEQVRLINEISLERALLALLDVEPGAAAEGRLLARVNEIEAQESDVKTRAAIGEMSDDELRNYVASLVPGLETKAAMGDEPRAVGTGGGVSVPDVGTARAEAASSGDKLA